MDEELAKVFSVVEKDGFDRKLEAAKKMVQWLVMNTEKLERAHQILNKRERPEEPEQAAEESEKVPKKKTKKDPEVDEDFVCPGQVWTNPAEPCVDKKNKDVPVGIKWNNKNWKVCKDCRNAKAKFMKKQNAEKKE